MAKNDIQKKVIDGMVVRLTFDGAFQRSKIYGEKVSDAQKKKFRTYLSSELRKIMSVIQYRKRYNDKDHCKMITRFSSEVTRRFKKILTDGKFRIGSICLHQLDISSP